MQLMSRLIEQHCALGPEDVEWLHWLVGEWQLLADLSFSDLVLWVPDSDPNIFWAVAQIRPTTGPTALEDDVAGDNIAYHSDHGVPEAYLSGETVQTSDNNLQAGVPVDVVAFPVRHNGRVIAVVERHTNQMGVRAPGSLEDNYLEIADVLTSMMSRGQYPTDGQRTEPIRSPRVGDGIIRLNTKDQVLYATPNAVTAYRRMGLAADLEDENLLEITQSLMLPNSPERHALDAVIGSPTAHEIEVAVGMISVRLRVLPLIDDDGPAGTLVLCRDVTELNKRDRELVTKDATIREIHHRVKNNLQTVAALLRMQARRIDSPEAKGALQEAMSRVSAIAVVHETLSQAYDQSVNFDDVADRVLKMVGAVAATGRGIKTRREGSFGKIPAEIATNLSLVITELVQNAIEHGLPKAEEGMVRIMPRATIDELIVEVVNDGERLPEDFSLQTNSSLGLSIVSTLVRDLGGTFSLTDNTDGPGTTARIALPISGIEEPEHG